MNPSVLRKINPVIIFGLAFVLWGINVPLIKIGLESIPATAFVAIKYALGSIIVLPFLVKNWQPLRKGLGTRILLATIVGYVINLQLLYAGLRLATGSSSSLIMIAGPILLYILSIEVLKERFNSKILFGLTISVVGTVFIVINPLLNNSAGTSLLGNLLVFFAVVADVLGTILIKPILKDIKPMQVSALRIIIATVFFLIIAMPQLLKLSYSTLPLEAYVAIIYGTLFALVLGLFAYHYGLSKISGEESSVPEFLTPIFGVISSVIILGERLNTEIVVGAALVFWGIYIAEARFKTHPSILHHPRH